MASTPAQGLVTKAFAVHARSACQRNAIVARLRKSYYVLIVEMREKARVRMSSRATSLSLKLGPACLSAAISASGSSTVASTSARRNVTHRRLNPPTVRDRPTLCRTVHVERHRSRRFQTRRENHVKIQYQAAHSLVEKHFPADISASRCATRATAGTAERLSSLSADAAAHPRTQSATRVKMKHLSVCASVAHS